MIYRHIYLNQLNDVSIIIDQLHPFIESIALKEFMLIFPQATLLFYAVNSSRPISWVSVTPEAGKDMRDTVSSDKPNGAAVSYTRHERVTMHLKSQKLLIYQLKFQMLIESH